MFEIGQGRIYRDALTMEDIIRNRNGGLSPGEIDFGQNQLIDAQDRFGLIVTYLKRIGLIESPEEVTFNVLTLRDRYPDFNTDELADHLINHATGMSAVAGVAKRMASRSNVVIELAGVSAEAIGTFVVSANLILRLANLYDIRLSTYETEILLLTVLSAAKVSVFMTLPDNSVNNPLSRIMDSFGEKWGLLRSSGKLNKLPNLFRRFIGQPTIGNALRNEIAAANAGHSGNIAITGNPIIGPVTGFPPIQTQPIPTQPQIPTQPLPGPLDPQIPQPPPPPTTPTEEEPRDMKTRLLRFGVTLVSSGLSGAWSAGQTYAVGQLTKRALAKASRAERAANNESFRRFMLTPEHGDGVLKLLILAMNVGKSAIEPIDVKNPTDPRVAFILNLARSARICTDADHDAYSNAKDKDGKLKISQRQFEILEYACDSKLSSGRLTRLYTEFQTFNEIPQEALPDLRIVNRQYRLRIGELLLQLQMLDGDRNWEEIKFFNMVSMKYLGFEEPADKNYFKRLQSYIVDNNGMRAEPLSPTGYTINTRPGQLNPYDMSIGYMTTNGPDLPPGPKRTPPQNPIRTSPTIPGLPLPTSPLPTTPIQTTPIPGIPQLPGTAIPVTPPPQIGGPGGPLITNPK
jgi:hypothetical protein